MPNTVLYVCPDCEPGPYMFAGKIVTKVCSRCADRRQNAKTGYDRARTGADRCASRSAEVKPIWARENLTIRRLS